MKRLRARISVLTILWTAVGIIVASVLWALIHGLSESAVAVAAVGALLFIVAGTVFAGEVNAAIAAVNFRVDDRVRHGTAQDDCIAKIEKAVGIGCDEPDPEETGPRKRLPRPSEAPR